MHIPTIQMQYGISDGYLQTALEGFNASNATQHPQGGNSATWLLSHIIATRQAPLMFTGSDTLWQPEHLQRWLRDPEPLQADEALAWEQLLSDLESSKDALMSFLASADDATLDIDTPAGKVSEVITFLAAHEAYHVGQVAMLRRVLE